jgi:hypothetical protein
MTTLHARPLKAIRSLAATLLVAASFTAGASGAWLSGPSAISVGESALFTGRKLAPAALVYVNVIEPTGYRHRQMVNVSADGTVKYELLARSKGVYTVQIASPSGEVLGTATLVVA